MKITKPNKNRKRRYNAPNHVLRKYLSAPLSPSLKIQYGAKTMPVRLDDTLMVTKGDRKLTEGKVIRVDTKKCKLYIEGLTRTKLDGTVVQIPIRPENVMIVGLELKDPKRKAILDRRGFEAKKGDN